MATAEWVCYASQEHVNVFLEAGVLTSICVMLSCADGRAKVACVALRRLQPGTSEHMQVISDFLFEFARSGRENENV